MAILGKGLPFLPFFTPNFCDIVSLFNSVCSPLRPTFMERFYALSSIQLYSYCDKLYHSNSYPLDGELEENDCCACVIIRVYIISLLLTNVLFQAWDDIIITLTQLIVEDPVGFKLKLLLHNTCVWLT